MPISPENLTRLSQVPLNETLLEFENDTDATNSVHLLSQRDFLTLEGPDAVKFMQGQLSCDVNSIDNNYTSRGAHCTPKGRAIASFYLAKHAEESYLFALPADNREALAKSLGKYIVFSKATINADDDKLALGLTGPAVTDFITQHIGPIPKDGNTVLTDQGLALMHDSETVELWLTNQQFTRLWDAIKTMFSASGNSRWYSALNRLGKAEISEATREEFVPQMFGLQEDDGISYKKGCYTGQEIVARLHFLGKQKRQLYYFEHSIELLASATTIQNADGKNIGSVVNASADNGLAVISSDEECVSGIIGSETITLTPAND